MNDSTALANVLQDTSALVALTQGEVDVQITTAKRYPRSIEAAIQKVEKFATLDRDTAESCFYSLPMEGGAVSGPSVRLAEIVLGAWGNARAATRCIEVTHSHVKCQGVFFDLENNISVSQEVSRSILTKGGTRYKESQIMKTISAGCAIALRNAVFKAVPMGVFKGTLDKIKKVASGSEKEFKIRVDSALLWFEKAGVQSSRILDHFGVKSRTEMTIEHLTELTGIRNAIKDDELTIADAFPAQQKAAAGTAPKSLDDVVNGAKPAPEPAPESRENPVDPAPVEPQQPVGESQNTIVPPEQGKEPETKRKSTKLF